VAFVERPQVGCGHRRVRGLGSHRHRAVPVRGAEDQTGEGSGRQRRGVVTGLHERGQPLLADPLEIGVGEPGTQHDVGEQRKRLLQLRGRRVQRDRRRVETGAGVE